VSFSAEVSRVIDPLIDACATIYRYGWAENHAGNLSYRLDADEVAQFPRNSDPRAFTFPTAFTALGGQSFIVTAAGSPFRLLEGAPQVHLGLITLTDDGSGYSIIWGFTSGKVPTSELPAHLLGHQERQVAHPDNRVVLHCHATNVVAMTHIHEPDEGAMTRTLWSTNSECVLAFPDGIGLLPWMVCGTDLIGRESAEKFRDSRLVIWSQHGVLASGASIDETLGLIESVEKAAEVYLLTVGRAEHSISDGQLRELAVAFKLSPREDLLPLVAPAL